MLGHPYIEQMLSNVQADLHTLLVIQNAVLLYENKISSVQKIELKILRHLYWISHLGVMLSAPTYSEIGGQHLQWVGRLN